MCVCVYMCVCVCGVVFGTLHYEMCHPAQDNMYQSMIFIIVENIFDFDDSQNKGKPASMCVYI